jgi:Tol biopolymer transport system component
MYFKTNLAILFLLCCIGVALVGCGAKRPATSLSVDTIRQASISLKIRWPEQKSQSSRLIPTAANSIKIELRDAQNMLIGGTPKVIERPTTGDTSNVVFNALPIGRISVTATAFPNTDGTGVAQANGIIPITIAGGQVTAATLAMDSTITQLRINGDDGSDLLITDITYPPSSMIPDGEWKILSAQALNAAGETVLVANSQWEWSLSNTTDFSLFPPSNEYIAVLSSAIGTTTLTLRDKESGKIATIPVRSKRNVRFSKIAYSRLLTIPVPSGSEPQSRTDILVMDGIGRTLNAVTNDGFYNANPSITKDGSKIVYERCYSTAFNDSREIQVVNSDGTNSIRLTNNVVKDAEACFSADGSKVVFVRGEVNKALFIINLDGTQETRLTPTLGRYSHPSFSPDGTKILFTLLGVIHIMNIDGTNVKTVGNSSGTDNHAVFSPDGSMIAFTRFTSSNYYEVFLMNADGTNVRQVTDNRTNGESNLSPAFSPDGTKIVFSKMRNVSPYDKGIYFVNIDGTSEKQVLTSSKQAESYYTSWSDFQR